MLLTEGPAATQQCTSFALGKEALSRRFNQGQDFPPVPVTCRAVLAHSQSEESIGFSFMANFEQIPPDSWPRNLGTTGLKSIWVGESLVSPGG